MTEFNGKEAAALERMRGLHRAGYFNQGETVPMPEIVADGDEAALHDLLEARAPQDQPQAFDYTEIEKRAAKEWWPKGVPPSFRGLMEYGAAPHGAFCECCGAMLRCTVCSGKGTESYCLMCGQRTDSTGQCKNECWGDENG